MTVEKRPSRRHRALVSFLLKAEFDAVLHQTSFDLADQDADPSAVWRLAHDARNTLAPLALSAIEPLPADLLEQAEAVRARPAYLTYYERVAEYDFGLAPLGALLAPQMSADLEYVDFLAASIGDDVSPATVFRFCMPTGHLTAPIVAGNSVVFSSNRPDLFASPIPSVEVTDEGSYVIRIEAHSRPNLLQVAMLGDRLILANGVHKALALQRRGVEWVPCVWRRIGAIAEVGLPQGNLDMFQPATVMGARPALIGDYLNTDVSVDLMQPATNQVLRVVVNVESITVPLPLATG